MKKSYLIAFLVAVLATLWIASGIFMSQDSEINKESAQQEAATSPKIMTVRVRILEAETVTGEIIVTGRTQASRSIELKAETPGLVTKVTEDKGAFVTENQIIATLEERDRQARVAEAKERLTQRQIEYNAAKELQLKGFNSKVRLAQAGADLEAAKATLKDAQISLGNITIKAPFDGIIANQHIEIGDYVAIGDPLFSFVDLNPIEVRGFVTEQQVSQIKIKSPTQIRFVNGMIKEGTVTYIAPAANPQTRTFEIEISIANSDHDIIDGMTADIFIPTDDKRAHKISPSVLSLNDNGIVGVKIVNKDNKVEFLPVQILSDHTDYMLVSGLPDTITLITVGQDFVIPGQIVDSIPAEGDGLL